MWSIRRIQVPNPFISFANHHVLQSADNDSMRPHVWWANSRAFCFCCLPLSHRESHVCLSLFSSLRSAWALQHQSEVHSLGSKGSKTVALSSLVIGHGHANQTGRNLQLIRSLPPAIIVPRHWPQRPPLHKINYILGSIPTIGFPVLELHYREKKEEEEEEEGVPKQHSQATFSLTEEAAHLRKAQKAKTDTRPSSCSSELGNTSCPEEPPKSHGAERSLWNFVQ